MADNISEELKCPICFEIPENEIFQCVNGHTVCSGCCETLSECPQCRVKFESQKIRNRALENLLDGMKFECANKSAGCTAKLSRGELSNHLDTCRISANTYKFCEYLGYDCDSLINTDSLDVALPHLQKDHGFLYSRNNSNLEINLKGLLNLDGNQTSFWTPIILDLESIPGLLLFISCYNRDDQTVSMTVIHAFSETTNLIDIDPTNILVKTALKSINPGSPDLQWIIPPLHIKHTNFAIKHPYFRVSKDLLRDNYAKKGSLSMFCSVLKDDINPLQNSPPEIINTHNSHTGGDTASSISSASTPILSIPPLSRALKPKKIKKTPQQPEKPPIIRIMNALSNIGQVTVPKPVQEEEKVGPVKFKGIRCDVCEETPLVGWRCRCLQCPDFDLCLDCMQKGEHEQHVFALIQSKKQNSSLKRRMTSAMGPIPLFPEELVVNEIDFGQLSILGKTTIKCLCKLAVKYVCLKCRPRMGYCETCFGKSGNDTHVSEHVFAVVNTWQKLELVSQNMPEIY